MSVQVDGHSLPALNGTKTGLLLVRLLLEQGERLSRSELAATFWPDLPPAAARSNLRQHLFQINRNLGVRNGEVLVADAECVAFNHACGATSDVGCLLYAGQDIDDITAALESYAGAFLAGTDHRLDSTELRQWILDRREYYWQQVIDRLARLTIALADAGRAGDALPHVERFLRKDPVDETLHRLKLRALLDAGLPDAARRHFKQCCETLERELGVGPDAATVALRDAAERAMTPDSEAAGTAASLQREERLVTIVCCEFEAAECGDLETRTLAVQEQAEAAAERLRARRGHVIPVHGGALLAYFGYPAADEEAAVNAVRAAMCALDSHQPGGHQRGIVAARALVHADLIVTGEDPDMPDPAGRLSGQALRHLREVPSGSVALTADVRASVDGFFEHEPIASALPDGARHPHGGLWRVVRDTGLQDRVDTRRSLAPATLLGRDAEYHALQRCWQRVCSRQTSVMLVRGDPGIGKSHLVRNFAREVRAREGNRVMLLRGLRQTRHAMGEPLRRGLLVLLDLAGEEAVDPDQVGAALRRRVSLDEPSIEVLSAFVGAPDPLGMQTAGDAMPQRERLIEALLAMTRQAVDREGLLLACDDVQWVDSFTLEVLRRVALGLPAAPVMVLLAGRTDFVSPWPDLHVEELLLGPLDAVASEHVVARMDREQRLAPAVRADIAARGEGIPLFLEELTRDRMAYGTEHGTGMSGTLRQYLAARLERLGSTREVAQCAAIIGRTFDIESLQHLAGIATGDLAAILELLRDQGLVEPQPGAPAGTFRFCHALFQRAAYDCQLGSERARLHGIMADLLQQRAQSGVAVAPAQLACHLQAAHQPAAAVPHHLDAGHAALAAAMHREAATHFADALTAIEASSGDDELAIEALVGEGSARVALEGYGAAGIRDLFSRAATRESTHTAASCRFRIRWGQWVGASSAIGFDEALRLAADMERIAEDEDDRRLRIVACYAQSNTHYWTGDFRAALRYSRQAAALYDEAEDHAALTTRFGEDCGFSARAYATWALWQIGRGRQAVEEIQALCEQVDACGHPATRAYVHTFAAVLAQMTTDTAGARKAAATAANIAREMHYPMWATAAGAIDAWARAHEGETAALGELATTVAAMREAMDGVVTYFLYLQMQATRELGLAEDIDALANEALAQGLRTGERYLRPAILLLRGVSRLDRARDRATADVGRHDLDAAITEARAQGAVLVELRALGERLCHAENAHARSAMVTALQDALARHAPEECTIVREVRALAEEPPLASIG